MKTFFVYLYLIAYSSCSVQKTFDKKYVTKKSIKLAKVKTLHASSNQMNKITCSSLCLRDSRENCNAFRVNSKNECELIENPEQLQAPNPDCMDGTEPFLWTVKDLKPPIRDQYVMVVGGKDPPYTEILNLGCPTFQCKNQALPTIHPTWAFYGGVINKTPLYCGGEIYPGKNNKYWECFKLVDQDWKQLSGHLDVPRFLGGGDNVVINDHLLVSGGIKSGKPNVIKLQELVPLNGNIMSSPSPLNEQHSYYGHCIIQLNETSILVTGGAGTDVDGTKTTFQNFATKTQKSGPKLIVPRKFHACGKMNINGEPYLIVVGGRDGHGKGTQLLALNSDNPKWDWGKRFSILMFFFYFVIFNLQAQKSLIHLSNQK